MVEGNTTRIMICADDFGMSVAIDAGILELAGMGRLSATSCLSQGPAFAASAKALQIACAQARGFQAGLHLNFTEALGAEGLFHSLPSLIMAAWSRQLDMQTVRRQIVHQLELFEAGMGRAPDFVDGHQHVHQFPQIRTALLEELDRRYGAKRPWLRSTRAGSMAGLPARLRLKAAVVDRLGSRALARAAHAAGYSMNRRFLGVYDFKGGPDGYAALLRQWLSNAVDGDLIMCHPAASRFGDGSLAEQRHAEYRTLASPLMGKLMQHCGIVLV